MRIGVRANSYVRPMLLVGILTLLACQQTAPSLRPEGTAGPTALPSLGGMAGADPVDHCVGFQQAVLPEPPVTYPTGTPAELKAGLATDASYLHTIEDLAGVRQDSNPLRDLAVQRCAVAEMVMGEPIFVRDYPRSVGSWFVPVTHEGRQIVLVQVGRDEFGRGTAGGSSWRPMPPISELAARAALTAPGDAVASVELVFARYQGSGPPDQIAWRAVRASGAAVYLFPDFPGVPAPGLVAAEAEVDFGY